MADHDETMLVRLVRGVIGGVLAGMVFTGVTMWFATTMPGGKADMPLRMISTIVKGSGAMAAGTTSPELGLIVHLVLSAAFGVVFVLAVPLFRSNGTVALAGTAYGALLYVVNFLVLAKLAFHVFEQANQPFELFAHIVFGTLLSFAFFGTGVRRSEHVIALPSRRPIPH
ncbi:MAG: hypothetical protein J2P17_34950 [Mycobacterium sp.]|nr:hypothetical protein [Mycobacterium sp.]